ncbi:MAG TPA: DUF1553 domain-containing protein [Planctomycetaceae bacterium]|nr:DUF1553 domain-containing protein [Planctomycetaceae bacterium]
MLVLLLMLLSAADPTAEQTFRDDLQPILERRCVSCHNHELKKGGLSLQSATGLNAGGDSGPAILPRKADESPLLQAVIGEKPEMPKSGPPLSAKEVAAIRTWIERGGEWPDGLILEERPQADSDWWSLQPLKKHTVPAAVHQFPVQNPIDRFVGATLFQRGLSPSPEADRRTLIRRLSFDLLGLPPTPGEIDAFVADPRPDAYEQFVDRLLASPHYGERWARHWLDVVHYGDTHGYDKDQLRPNAWPYRDYVIRAFNTDKPYGDFIREQIAGDVFAPNSPDGLPALGFVAAGPWDFISHVEVPETKTDGQIARSLDRDDMVVNTLNTFCSTTVQCARCHAHKFDPISQADYYRLQAVFAAVDRADKPYDADPNVASHRRELLADDRELSEHIKTAEARIAELAGPELAALEQQLRDSDETAKKTTQVPPEFGYHSQIESQPDRTKWVQIDLSEPTTITRVVLIPCHDTFNNIGAGFGFPPRYKVEAADDAAFEKDVVTLVDRTAADIAPVGITPQQHSVPAVRRRYLRITATKLAPRQNDYICAIAELQAFSASGQNVALNKPVTAIDSIEAAPRWRNSNLVDGKFPHGANALPAEERRAIEHRLADLREQRIPRELRHHRSALLTRQAAVRTALAELPPAQPVYLAAVHHGSGNFVGRGALNGQPRPIHILARGDVRKPTKEVGPGVPPLVPGFPSAFELPAHHTESQRRAMLAEWVASPQNPLTWRSIVNRVWHYHFGRGLVDSPNDFGRMGQLPTHPELLDWLALNFREDGGSLKSLHRLIVTSHTYRQTSTDRPDAAKTDAQNSLLWRANRRKLDAEGLRDSLLFVAGRLDDRMGGPGFRDFIIERPEHSPHFEYHLHDPRDPRAHRRSVYRFLVRSQPQPFMSTLDCADPSISVDKRNETINPLQALALLNNGLTVVMAESFAADVPQSDLADSVTLCFRRAIGRDSTADECAILTDYARMNGLANTCRVILNLNEFAFVD